MSRYLTRWAISTLFVLCFFLPVIASAQATQDIAWTATADRDGRLPSSDTQLLPVWGILPASGLAIAPHRETYRRRDVIRLDGSENSSVKKVSKRLLSIQASGAVV